MGENGAASIIKPELIRELRSLVNRGTSVRELTQVIQSRLGCESYEYLPVLAAFVHSFCLPLKTVLPIREWIGSCNDAEMDALLVPENLTQPVRLATPVPLAAVPAGTKPA